MPDPASPFDLPLPPIGSKWHYIDETLYHVRGHVDGMAVVRYRQSGRWRYEVTPAYVFCERFSFYPYRSKAWTAARDERRALLGHRGKA